MGGQLVCTACESFQGLIHLHKEQRTSVIEVASLSQERLAQICLASKPGLINPEKPGLEWRNITRKVEHNI
jgi:hypothetical protein